MIVILTFGIIWSIAFACSLCKTFHILRPACVIRSGTEQREFPKAAIRLARIPDLGPFFEVAQISQRCPNPQAYPDLCDGTIHQHTIWSRRFVRVTSAIMVVA